MHIHIDALRAKSVRSIVSGTGGEEEGRETDINFYINPLNCCHLFQLSPFSKASSACLDKKVNKVTNKTQSVFLFNFGSSGYQTNQ